MKKALLLLMLSFLSGIIFAQTDIAPAAMNRPDSFNYLSAPDSAGKRAVLKSPQPGAKAIPKIPYPIIFIHGLNSSSATWDTYTNWLDSQYGFTYGGRFDFCLNFDGDNTIANKNFWPASGADLALYTNPSDPAQIIKGDYYYLNFDIGSDGSVFPSSSDPYFVLSNQSAIAKQGLALKWAIYYVLQKTGRDKVILMGHSMGGLASREYLQNSALWQPDGKDHVAKLVTTGTPHGGSNSSLSIFSGIFSGVDNQSEAVRDLRTSYYYSGDPGVYLFGGLESNSVMDDMLMSYFYNVDVNCNGAAGNTITGLNQKSISSNLDYSCIVGVCSGCLNSPGDGVVGDYQADLTNYYPSLNAELFYYYASALTQIHTDLPGQSFQNMEGLDEPDEYWLSYHTGFDTTYTAFISQQPAGGYSYDYDDYKFKVTSKTNVSVSVNNINLSDLMAQIVDLSGNTVGTTVHSSGSSTLHFTQTVNAGDYYLEIFGTPTSTSYLYPYTFTLNKAALADFTANTLSGCPGMSVSFTDLSTANPTSWSWSFAGGTPSSSSLKNPSNIIYNNPGTYNVMLTASNSYGSDTYTKTLYITVNPLPSVSLSAFSPVCENAPQFALSGGSPAGGTYSGSGVSNNNFNPALAGTGSHTITYTYTNPTTGCSNSATGSITVNAAPAAPVAGSNAPVCEGSALSLYASSTTGAVYSWTGPNGFSSSIQNPVVSADATDAMAGTYFVTASLNGCSGAVSSTTVIVRDLPVITVGPDNPMPSICSGASADIFASGGSSYTWSPATGLSSTNGTLVMACPANTTVYTVTGTNAVGCSNTSSITVTVNQSPSISISPASSLNICTGGSVQLTASGGTAYNWSPAVGLNSVTGAVVTANPTTTTTYQVIGKNATGCVETSSITITVSPTITVAVTPDQTMCSGVSIPLLASGATSYTWTPATGLSASTGANVTASPPATTVYTVTGTSGACTASASVMVTVAASINVSVSSSQAVCSGASVPLLAGGATNYSWSPTTGLSASTGASVTASPASTTVYTVTGTSGSCTNSANVTITVNPKPAVTACANQAVCAGNSVSLSASGAVAYTWIPAAGLSAATGASVMASPMQTTKYTITGTSALGCSDTANTTVTVNALPAVIAVSEPGAHDSVTLCAGEYLKLFALGAANYLWSPATGLNQTTGAMVIANPQNSAVYSVSGTDGFGCVNSSTIKITVINCNKNSSGDADEIGCINIFPNPSGNSTTLSITDYDLQKNNVEFILYDLQGQEVKKFRVTIRNTPVSRDNLKSGIYFFRVKDNSQIIATGKLVLL